MQKTSFIWLTQSKVANVPSETNIEILFKLVKEFIEKGEKSVILIDRLDYLLSANDFAHVLKVIHELKDLSQQHDAVIIMSANPELVEETQLKAIEAESIDLFGKHLKKKVDLTEQESAMLQFINDRNINHQMVSFKDLTQKFAITKPTTRSKVRMLQELGLLQVENKGRIKSLKITSAGRRVIA